VSSGSVGLIVHVDPVCDPHTDDEQSSSRPLSVYLLTVHPSELLWRSQLRERETDVKCWVLLGLMIRDTGGETPDKTINAYNLEVFSLSFKTLFFKNENAHQWPTVVVCCCVVLCIWVGCLSLLCTHKLQCVLDQQNRQCIFLQLLCCCLRGAHNHSCSLDKVRMLGCHLKDVFLPNLTF